MLLIVKTRDKTIFNSEVDNVSSYNKVGIFSILSDHANFISIIEKKLIIKQRGSTQEIELQNGLMKVIGNQVNVYVGIK